MSLTGHHRKITATDSHSVRCNKSGQVLLTPTHFPIETTSS